jgi:hypothetical protein
MEEKVKEHPPVKINDDMPDFSKDPYFVKKHAEAKEFYLKCPMPQELVDKILKELE